MLRKNDILDFKSWRLNESLSSARERFLDKGLIDLEAFDQLKALDPTPSFKYLDKIIDFYLNDERSIEEIGQVISRFNELSKKNQLENKDINSYKDWNSLSSIVNSSNQNYIERKKIKDRAKDADVVYEDKNWLVVLPKTKEASCKYGANTKWCISADEKNMFDVYYHINGITTYIIIPKNSESQSEKMAISVYQDGSKEAFDSGDNKIDVNDIPAYSQIPSSVFINRYDAPPTVEIILNSFMYKTHAGVDNVIINSDGSITVKASEHIIVEDTKKYQQKKERSRYFFYDEKNGFHGLIRQVIGINDYGEPKYSDLIIVDFNRIKKIDGSLLIDGCNSIKRFPIVEVTKNLSINDYQNETLEGCPQSVGSFTLGHATRVSTLEGCPQKVLGDFEIAAEWKNGGVLSGKTKSLIGSPTKIEGNFRCSHLGLTSLEGAPQEVKGHFWCGNNELLTLEGAPKRVGKGFFCGNNKLKDLVGAPQEVGEHFECYKNSLETLEGAPKQIAGRFVCSNNLLKNLIGSPRWVGENFDCTLNPLVSLEGAPKIVGATFGCTRKYLSEPEIEWAKKNIEAKYLRFDL